MMLATSHSPAAPVHALTFVQRHLSPVPGVVLRFHPLADLCLFEQDERMYISYNGLFYDRHVDDPVNAMFALGSTEHDVEVVLRLLNDRPASTTVGSVWTPGSLEQTTRRAKRGHSLHLNPLWLLTAVVDGEAHVYDMVHGQLPGGELTLLCHNRKTGAYTQHGADQCDREGRLSNPNAGKEQRYV